MKRRIPYPQCQTSAERALFHRSIMDVLDAGVPGVFVELGLSNGRGARFILATFEQREADRTLAVVEYDWKRYERGMKLVRRAFPEASIQSFHGFTHIVAEEIDVPVAWLYIDACHCYDCVLDDIELWGAKIPPGGVLVLHDIRPELCVTDRTVCFRGLARGEGPTKRKYGVAAAIAVSPLLREEFEHIEIIMQPRRCGLSIYRRRGGAP